MEIHQLYYFVAVAETGGFSKAAERCSVSQPSLSQQIMKLEQELGNTLFDRLGRTVALTEAGKVLLPHARSVLAEIQEIKWGLNHQINEGHGQLSVGFIPTIAPFLLPGAIKTFAEMYPHTELSVYEDLTGGLVRDLIGGKLDVGFMSLPIDNKLIATEELFAEPLWVASSRRHNLIKQASIRAKELANFPFIALNEVHCLGEQVQSFCYQKAVNLDIVCYTSQLSTVKSCIALGLGISLVPQMLAASDTSGQLKYHLFSDDIPSRKIVAATHTGRRKSFLARQFISLVGAEYKNIEAEFKAGTVGVGNL